MMHRRIQCSVVAADCWVGPEWGMVRRKALPLVVDFDVQGSIEAHSPALSESAWPSPPPSGSGPSVTKAHPIVPHGKAQLVMIERLKANTNAAASTVRERRA